METRKEREKRLDDTIIAIIGEYPGISSGNLFHVFSARVTDGPKTMRAFDTRLKRLLKEGRVDYTWDMRGRGGTTRKWWRVP